MDHLPQKEKKKDFTFIVIGDGPEEGGGGGGGGGISIVHHTCLRLKRQIYIKNHTPNNVPFLEVHLTAEVLRARMKSRAKVVAMEVGSKYSIFQHILLPNDTSTCNGIMGRKIGHFRGKVRVKTLVKFG
ncbi:hypothetical protein ACJX0J_025714, partial [Zea mays]